jgi:hypothetical protein
MLPHLQAHFSSSTRLYDIVIEGVQEVGTLDQTFTGDELSL